MTATDPVQPPGEAAPEILEGRIWVDGCFDFFHHGHAGAIVQARQLGDELYVGVHSDEAILENKGPTVMTLDERMAAVDACRWVTQSVSRAPYVTDLGWISHYGCKYVVHGDDITSDSSGEDCYRFVKEAGRFRVVKRTPSISTTDLVGRMLLCTRTHFIRSLEKALAGLEGSGTAEEKKEAGEAMTERMRLYATDASAKRPGADVYFWAASQEAKATDSEEERGSFRQLFDGPGPKPGQRIAEEEAARGRGWYEEKAVAGRVSLAGVDYAPAFVVAGVHDDDVINQWKGVNYPIMNIYERVRELGRFRRTILAYQAIPDRPPSGTPDVVYHGPTSFMPLTYDPYTAPKEMGIYQEIGAHSYEDVNAGTIVQRIMKSRDVYEARQRAKGVKAEVEAAHRERELLEQEQLRKEAERGARSTASRLGNEERKEMQER
ncbi:unnamed protein product [Parascedosporium putredinis]|uniref:ethanolamine-phosphate cytidylyltransferase n=1 Tax=Parascedosporium putredinis TaxID=1442378 RepID=A0A9P1MA04_9PEZI|nr:unnamed protein product [Parascedosporium putredinis]CAI7995759.1 unnamed protein product [Parascedosporium putredinis]